MLTVTKGPFLASVFFLRQDSSGGVESCHNLGGVSMLSKVKESEANRFEAAFETFFIDRDFSVITTWAKPIAFFRRIYGNVRS